MFSPIWFLDSSDLELMKQEWKKKYHGFPNYIWVKDLKEWEKLSYTDGLQGFKGSWMNYSKIWRKKSGSFATHCIG